MAQTTVVDYFATRKRRPNEDLQNKQKVLILDDNNKRKALPIYEDKQITKSISTTKVESKKESVVRNLFDMPTKSSTPRPRTTRSRRASVTDDKSQPDIRETMLKVNKEIEEAKNVMFEKLGSLSPKKTPRTRRATRARKVNETQETQSQEPAICLTPTKKTPTKEMSIDEIKSKITKSSRLAELRAKINNLKSCDDKLSKLDQKLKDKKEESKKNIMKLKEFDRIELEIPVSPQKALLSPQKFTSPSKSVLLSPKASPAKRLLYEPKEETPTPVYASPTKAPAYQRYQGLAEEGKPGLILPYKYRLLFEMFRSIDSIVAILYNRKETITYSKLKTAVQEQLRRTFTLDHLAQIKTIYPDAFSYRQEKVRSFGSKYPDKYELIITPVINDNKERSGRNTPDEDNVIRSASNTHMCPSVLLDRKNKFYNALLDIAKDCHDEFLKNLSKPMHVDKNKITRWHMLFDVESCRDIPKAELPQPPKHEKVISAKDVLEKANKMFNDNSRMKKAMALLAEQKAKEEGCCTPKIITSSTNTDILDTSNTVENVSISIVDTPPATPKTPLTSSLLKGIPNSLLEKIRAKQAAKALEMMTRTTDDNKDAIMYSRLPEMAKIIRNIFVGEKKNVLPMEHVVKKLDDSYRKKLTNTELEEHIKLISKLLPLWATIHNVRKIEYLKLAKDFDMAKVSKRLEVLADEKA